MLHTHTHTDTKVCMCPHISPSVRSCVVPVCQGVMNITSSDIICARNPLPCASNNAATYRKESRKGEADCPEIAVGTGQLADIC